MAVLTTEQRVTYTLELTEAELRGLRALLFRNLTGCAISALGLTSLYRALAQVAPADVVLVHSPRNHCALQAKG